MSNPHQGEAWKEDRRGCVTASRIADVIAKTKTGYGAARGAYMAQLIAERLSGRVAETFQSGPMRWGIEMEPDARAAYEFERNCDVQLVGYIPHGTIAETGASPDGLVGADGGIEIKCPNTQTHIETLLSGEAPAEYMPQMQWQMACTGRQWWDFASFDPRMPESMALFVKRVPRDDATIATLEDEVLKFLAELTAKVEALRSLYEREAA